VGHVGLTNSSSDAKLPRAKALPEDNEAVIKLPRNPTTFHTLSIAPRDVCTKTRTVNGMTTEVNAAIATVYLDKVISDGTKTVTNYRTVLADNSHIESISKIVSQISASMQTRAKRDAVTVRAIPSAAL